jgi:hypothetical protein
VQHQHRIAFGGTIFHPCHPQLPAVVVVNFAIHCAIREFRQIGEAFVGRAQTLHDREHTEYPYCDAAVRTNRR